MSSNDFTKAAAPGPSDVPAPRGLCAYYKGIDDPAIDTDLAALKSKTDDFAARYKDRLAGLTPDELGQAYLDYDALTDSFYVLYAYAQARVSENVQDPAAKGLYGRIEKEATQSGNTIAFFAIEIAKIPEAQIAQALAASPVLAGYKETINGQRRSKLLDEPVERALAITARTGANAWSKYHDETLADVKYSLDGESMSLEKILGFGSSADRAKRQKAMEAVWEGLKTVQRSTTKILNMVIAAKQDSDEMRGYPTAVSARNLSNNIEDDVVEALNDTVRANYAALSHRYYKVKADYLGLDALEPWDRNAPLSDDDSPMSWGEAERLARQYYREFSPDMGDIVDMFFDKRWIDATQREGKAGGAYAHPGAVGRHPFMHINWEGKRRNFFTLMHELGHNVHQYLAAQETKSALKAETPLTLAETASIFGENIAFEKMIEGERDPSKRIAMLGAKLDDLMNTMIRQIAFFNFELRAHDAVRNGIQGVRKPGELETKEINDIFIDTQKEALGPSIKIDDRSGPLWSYVTHFTHSPFYVYSYSMADFVVNALFKVYKEAKAQGPAAEAAFKAKYADVLKAGGTKHHSELLPAFGIHLGRDFFAKGVAVYKDYIDQLEQAITEEKTAKATPGPVAPQPPVL